MRKGLLVICSFLLFSFLFLLPVSAEEGSDSVETELIPGAVSGVLMEANSGKIVFAKEENKEVAVASMTKMVAQILILDAIREEKISWDDVVTVSQTAADMGGSQIYLSIGEKKLVFAIYLRVFLWLVLMMQRYRWQKFWLEVKLRLLKR